MNSTIKRIALNVGFGYSPGLNTVIVGAALAANELGWEVVGIRDGFEGLLFPDRYPDGGLVPLTPQWVETLDPSDNILGTAIRNDPFHVRTINAESLIEEVDRSDDLLATLQANDIDAVISVVGKRGLSILAKLHRKGLKTVSIPRSMENDIAATTLSFGFNSTLGFVTELLDRAKQAARSAGQVGVVEVPGEYSGWLALQAGMAVRADAALIPEIPYDLQKVAAKLQDRFKRGRSYGLVIVAEGAVSVNAEPAVVAPHPLKASLSPLATDYQGSHVIQRSGRAAHTVALELQRSIERETYPLVLGDWVKGGSLTAVDRQLGLSYGAGAALALNAGQTGVVVAFQPPDLTFVPLAEAINKIRTVPADSEFVRIARSLGICLGG
ncbi:6-phosphofructokinase [Pannus brasiliensis CCIBt3594]|uniref:6-phosphofructokinase n=1 Tax=Pannus brasiliensis CCIBt3594 TaxID=1427578 RepID=A0AAW9QQK6_9CHRO